MTPDQRAALRKLLNEATPGPWSVEDPMDHELTIVEANKHTDEWRFIAGCSWPDGDDDQDFTGREVQANADLIVAAVNALPALLDALDAQDALLKEAAEVLEPWRTVATLTMISNSLVLKTIALAEKLAERVP